jgi:hypothetical protein
LERDLSAVPFLFLVVLLGVPGGLGGSVIDLPFLGALASWRLIFSTKRRRRARAICGAGGAGIEFVSPREVGSSDARGR